MRRIFCRPVARASSGVPPGEALSAGEQEGVYEPAQRRALRSHDVGHPVGRLRRPGGEREIGARTASPSSRSGSTWPNAACGARRCSASSRPSSSSPRTSRSSTTWRSATKPVDASRRRSRPIARRCSLAPENRVVKQNYSRFAEFYQGFRPRQAAAAVTAPAAVAPAPAGDGTAEPPPPADAPPADPALGTGRSCAGPAPALPLTGARLRWRPVSAPEVET